MLLRLGEGKGVVLIRYPQSPEFEIKEGKGPQKRGKKREELSRFAPVTL